MFESIQGDESARSRKQSIALSYHLAAPGYDQEPLRFFVIGARRLVEIASISQSAVVLDVATGTGAAALFAAQAVGEEGRVIGIDFAAAMIAAAKSNASIANLKNVRFLEMDGDFPDFPEAMFDAILSSFGIFFMPDMGATMKRWRSLAKPGGVIAFNAIGESSLQPMTDLFEDRIRKYDVEISPQKRPFGWQRLTDPIECRSLLEGAGLYEVDVTREQQGYYLSGVEQWWDVVWNSGFRGLLNQLSPNALAEFRELHLKEIGELFVKDGLWMDIDLILARGSRKE